MSKIKKMKLTSILMIGILISSPSDELVYASGGIFEDGITNGKATIYYNYSNYVGRPFDKKGEYIVTFQIREDIVKGHPPVSVFHWGGERLINITKTTTSISFNTLKIDDKQTYPFTVGGND